MKRDWAYLGIVLLTISIIVAVFGQMNDPNEAYLRKLSPKVRIKFRNFLNSIKQLGFEPHIRESKRSYQKQVQYYQKDKRNALPGHSAHEIGQAIDMDLYKYGKVLSKNTSRADWISTGVPALAKAYGIQWGGNFKGYSDNNHFHFIT